MVNAHVRAANRIALNGGPVLKTPFEFAVALGDLADNQQFNETRWFIDIFDGAKLINPDSGMSENPEWDVLDDYPGPDDYDGVETTGFGTPGTQPPLESPVADDYLPAGMPNTLLNLANEPFWVEGFRRPDGSHLPWYSVMGNHDIKVQGTAPDDNIPWREAMRLAVVGHEKVNEPITPAQQQAFCTDSSNPDTFRNAFMTLITDPSITRSLVPADSDRRLLDKIDWINEHATTTGLPGGHGFLPETGRCPVGPAPAALSVLDANLFRRGCYSWVQEPFHHIVLDTNPLEGLQNGNIDDVQFIWLEEQLKSSSKTYFDASGQKVDNPSASDRLIVVYGHHPLVSTDNPGYPWNDAFGTPQSMPGVHMKEDLEKLLLRFPNVILLNAGHTHQNKVWAHQDPDRGTGFWEVNTAAVADIPTHSRTLEIADNLDGTLSIFSVVFDARGAANPRTIEWAADDPSNELAATPLQAEAQAAVVAARNINEEWLSSAGREVLFNDPQQNQSAVGAPEDWNVELMIGVPFPLPSGGRPKSLASTGSPNLLGAGAFIIAAAVLLGVAAARRRALLPKPQIARD